MKSYLLEVRTDAVITPEMLVRLVRAHLRLHEQEVREDKPYLPKRSYEVELIEVPKPSSLRTIVRALRNRPPDRVSVRLAEKEEPRL